jgi:hypothetical protein
MRIVCKSRENTILAHRQVPFDVVNANEGGIDQTLLVSTLDIVEQFCRIKVGAVGDGSDARAC